MSTVRQRPTVQVNKTVMETMSKALKSEQDWQDKVCETKQQLEGVW